RDKASCWSSRTGSGRSSLPTVPTCSNSDGLRWKVLPNAFSPIGGCRPLTSATAAQATDAARRARFRAAIESDQTEEKHHENEIGRCHSGGGVGSVVGRERGLPGASAWLSAVRGGAHLVLFGEV